VGKRTDRTRAVKCEGLGLTPAPTYCHTIGTPLLQRLAHTTTSQTADQFSTIALLKFGCSRGETSVMCGRAMHEGEVQMQMGERTLCDTALLQASSFGLPATPATQTRRVSMCSVCTDREGARRTNERAYPQEPFAKGSYETPASSSIKRSAADARAQALLASPAWPWETQNTVNGTQRPTQRRQLWKDRRGHGTVVWWRSSEQRDAHPVEYVHV
jgi:hypothetical protein